jgi:hypothetical protein
MTWRFKAWLLWHACGLWYRLRWTRPVRTCPHLAAGRCQVCVDTWPS